MYKGRVVFGAMEEVVFDRATAEAVVEQIGRLAHPPGLLTVGGTLSRATSEIRHAIRKITPRFPRKHRWPGANTRNSSSGCITKSFGGKMYTGKHARLRPLQPAFIMANSGEAVSYAELEARSNRLAHLFRNRGLKRLDHYAIYHGEQQPLP